MKISPTRLLEATGIIAVVVSLLFVGMQLIFDRRLAVTDQYSDRAESRMANVRTWLESDAYFSRESGLWNSGQRPIWWNEKFEEELNQSDLTGADIAVELLTAELDLLSFDNLYFQYEQGLLTEEFWFNLRDMYKDRLRNPRVRAIYANTSTLLPVQKLLEELVIEIENE